VLHTIKKAMIKKNKNLTLGDLKCIGVATCSCMLYSRDLLWLWFWVKYKVKRRVGVRKYEMNTMLKPKSGISKCADPW